MSLDKNGYVMNKKTLYKIFKLIKKFSFLWFLASFMIFSVIATFSLRANNQRMVELKEAVFEADKNDGDIETALKELRTFVYSHMNTDLASGANSVRPPIQLKYRYEKLVKAEKERVSAINAPIYINAQQECERRFPAGTPLSSRVACTQSLVESQTPEKEKAIPDALYKFDFASPRWSPDLAGWSIVIAGLSLVLFVLRVLSELAIKRSLKSHQ